MAKAWEIAGLTPDQPLGERARLIIITKFREAFHSRSAIHANEDIEAVHDMRVSLRRLWAAMRAFSNYFNKDVRFARLARRARKLARRLGAVRDLDVLIEMMQKHAQKAEIAEASAAAIDSIVARSMKQRAKQHKKLTAYLHKLAQQQFETQFLGFFAACQPSQTNNAKEIFTGVLEAFYLRAPQGDMSDGEALHQLRIAAKRLRYSLEFFETCYHRQLTSYLKSLRLLQELLGDIHDCDVMIELLKRRQEKLTIREIPALTLSGFGQLINDFNDQRAVLVEKFIALWQRRFGRGFKTRLLKILDLAGK